jgi:mRNA interferase RelE/StbE
VSEPPEDSDHDEADDKPQPLTVVLSPGARRALSEQLPAAFAFPAWALIKGTLCEAPRRVGAPLNAPFEGFWRALRGEYRVRYRIDEDKHQVVIMDVDHRRDVYRT